MNSIYHAGSPFVLVSAPGMHEIAEAILVKLATKGMHFPHHRLEYTRFANGEVLPLIPHTVRRQHVFFLHPLLHPDPNIAIMMMLLANDALKRASVAGITLVVPFLPYLRQDRKDKPRRPISARMLADLIESNDKVERIVTLDMHAEQEQGFFSIPVDDLSSMPMFVADITQRFAGKIENLAVVAADFGGAVRSRRMAKKVGDLPVAIFEKRRPSANRSEIVSLIGDSIVGKTAIIYEDMVDTGGSLLGVYTKLLEFGASEVVAYVGHGILSGDAEDRFRDSGLTIVCTDSIPRSADHAEKNPWLIKLPLADLLADAIYEASLVGGSVSKLSQ